MKRRESSGSSCAPVSISGCGGHAGSISGEPFPSFPLVDSILTSQSAVASTDERRRFVDVLRRSIRHRRIVKEHWKSITDLDDIIGSINDALVAGDTDEAIWQCFLAAHFGRPSARDTDQRRSASRFLSAFGKRLPWSWKTVSESPDSLREWLFNSSDELLTLAYGNHRKFESQKPTYVWEVIESFFLLAKEHGGPRSLLSASAEENGFETLYRRLRPLQRFARTGRFDLLVLLLDVGLISAEPKSCYLRGATGPLKGAKLLWGQRRPKELDRIATELATKMEVSPIVVEDALCNWQK